MLALDMTRDVRDFLNQLDPKRFKQVANKIFSLMENPEPADSSRLKGYPYRRTDIGEYRIIYRLEKGGVKVALIGKRNDDEVYRTFARGS